MIFHTMKTGPKTLISMQTTVKKNLIDLREKLGLLYWHLGSVPQQF